MVICNIDGIFRFLFSKIFSKEEIGDCMKNKGFTLAELLGVMVILALIGVITIPSVTSSLKKYRSELCESQLKEIVGAARSWASDNILKLPTGEGQTYTVSLKTLSDYGYIDAKIENPVTKDDFDLDDTTVTITRTGKKYTYTMDQDTVYSCQDNS